MFTSFSQGADDPGSWDQSPAYAPGRFHAHVRPTSPPPLVPSSRNSSSHNLPLAFAPSSLPNGRLQPHQPRTRPRPIERALHALSPDRRREAERARDGEERSLLGDWLSRSGVENGLGVEQRRAAFGDGAIAEEGGGAGAEDEEEDGGLLRPGRRRVEKWMSSWWRRWAVLVGAPCLIVWIWCAVPFPVDNPYTEEPPWHIPWPGDPPSTTISTSVTSAVAAPISAPLALGAPSERRYGREVDARRPLLLEILNNGPMPINSHSSVVAPPADEPELPVDANWWFFLLYYYGVYLAIALIFVTKLFDLFRVNWWPKSIGGSISYTFFWSLALLTGGLLHHFDLDGFGRRTRSKRPKDDGEEFDWERKTTWVLLAFATMALPALACFAKLRADRRNSFRRSLTPAQKTFLERQLTQRMPRSYRRFLWFLGTIALSLLALITGQAFATVYLSTLPHSAVDGLVYVWTWILTVNLLSSVSNWILLRKVRSQALVFVFRLYFFLVYHVFYRNLFARLRSPDQAAWITLLSSSFVIVLYPISMSKTFYRLLNATIGVDMEYAAYVANKGTELYLRNLSENVTMIGFLGWLSILHWGPNKVIYPYFAFDTRYDPYTYRLTLTASLVIYATELFSNYLARAVCWLCYEIDVTNLGLDQFREHPELVIACVFTSCHVLSDMLLFLVKLNFR
ncbi:hypothetical protein NBRC10513v2_004401 [Rhodotorula toruloides]